MALKVSANQSAVAHHIVDGPVTFAYAVDARHAIGAHPLEWSDEPWSREAETKAREAAGQEVEPLTAEEQAALDAHAAAVAEANDRLKAFREKVAAAKAEEDQAVRDEAVVKSAPPRPEPKIKRPFGRPGEPTPAELEQIRKREAKKAADDKMVADKAELDRLDAASRGGAPITG